MPSFETESSSCPISLFFSISFFIFFLIQNTIGTIITKVIILVDIEYS